ncbi:MAG TPA: hypothetical protein VFF52_19045 [Isosphaeraceae bacterium]|nr:hypothetical protein [Isosphaeraceae bacterium]
MSGDQLQERARRQPFQPFRLILTTGATDDIRHPDLIMVGRRSAVLGIAKNPEAARYDIATQVDLLQVVAFEAVPASPVSPKGPAS